MGWSLGSIFASGFANNLSKYWCWLYRRVASDHCGAFGVGVVGVACNNNKMKDDATEQSLTITMTMKFKIHFTYKHTKKGNVHISFSYFFLKAVDYSLPRS